MAADLNRYPVLMLDMNGTCRFGPLHDDHGTCRGLGGQPLSASALSPAINDFVATMSGLYDSPRLLGAFPSVAEVLCQIPASKGLGPVDMTLLESVISGQEGGTVPKAQAQAIDRLSQRHDLILVSNIWSRAEI